MLALMLDPRFKSLRVVDNYVEHEACICLVVEYDANIIIPLLTIVFEVLNSTVEACAIEVVGSIAGLVILLKKKKCIWCECIYGKVITCTCCWGAIFV
jgi:hypothetical protein